MRIPVLAVAAAVVLIAGSLGCKDSLPPSPSSLINGTRERLVPFRFTLATEPSNPHPEGPTRLLVHVIDGSGNPVTGATVIATVTTGSNSSTLRQVTLDDMGKGDYQGDVNLETPGIWDIDLQATREGKVRQQRFSIMVGG
jgi:hypothetical protein